MNQVQTYPLRQQADFADLVREDRVHGSLYTSPSVFQDEMDRIFHNGWVYAGHESEIPQPGVGELLVEVKAAGVNPFDWKLRSGLLGTNLPTPAGLGSEVSGLVAAIGEGVRSSGGAWAWRPPRGGAAGRPRARARGASPAPRRRRPATAGPPAPTGRGSSEATHTSRPPLSTPRSAKKLCVGASARACGGSAFFFRARRPTPLIFPAAAPFTPAAPSPRPTARKRTPPGAESSPPTLPPATKFDALVKKRCKAFQHA